MSTREHQDAVRAYLELQAGRFEPMPEDPIKRLHLRAALEREFIKYAASWARQYGIQWHSFAREEVPIEVLERAGLAPSVGNQDQAADSGVRAAIPVWQPFTIEGLRAKSGCSRSQVRRVIDAEIEDGRIREIAVSEFDDRRGSTTLYGRTETAEQLGY